MTEPVHNKKTAKNMLTIIIFWPFTPNCRILSVIQTRKNNRFTQKIRKTSSTY